MYLCSTIQKSEEDAIYQTMEDRDELACIIMDISPDANLNRFFRPLENNRSSEMILGKEKGRPHRRSWLRLYAIKLSVGIYIITGGAIKLTRTMQEREHTLQELEKMEKVRNFLIREMYLTRTVSQIINRRWNYDTRTSYRTAKPLPDRETVRVAGGRRENPLRQKQRLVAIFSQDSH